MENEKDVEILENEEGIENNNHNNLKKSGNHIYGELTREQFELMKKIRDETLSRTERYSELINNSNSNDMLFNISGSDISKKVKKNKNKSKVLNDNSNSNNSLDIINQTNKEKIDPNKERIYRASHPFLFINGEPIIVIGPETQYYVWIFSIVSFFSIIIYSIKNSNGILKFLFICGYLFFTVTYTLLFLLNPGFPTNKKDLDLNMLQNDYQQCKLCNAISLKQEGKMVLHCQYCEICIEHFDHHCKFATKCIGRKNKKIFKLWLYSICSFFVIIFIYLII